MSTAQQVYSVDDMFTSITDIYTQYDMGKITVNEARELMLLCSKEFVQHNNLSMLNVLKSMDKLEIITIGGKNSA
jgi:hypothetical protein